VTVYSIRILCNDPWNGGGGYSYEDVANMSQDQIAHRLCDIELLKDKIGKRTKTVQASGVAGLAKVDEQGRIKARDKDGNVIYLKTTGKSKAQQIREANEAKRKPTRRRRKRG